MYQLQQLSNLDETRGDIDVEEFVSLLFKEKIKILFVTCVFILVGTMYSFLSTPVYKVSTELDINIQNSSLLTTNSSGEIIYFPSLSLDGEIRKIRNFKNLIESYAEFEMPINKLSALQKQYATKFQVTAKRKTIIELSIQSENIETAKSFLDAVVKAYRNEQIQRTVDKANALLKLLDRESFLSQAEIAKNADENVFVFSSGNVSLVKPRKAYTIILSALLGVMFSSICIFIIALQAKGVRSLKQIERLGLTVFEGEPKSLALSVESSNHKASESLRFLRTSLNYQLYKKNSNVVMISAPRAEVGKMATALDLADLEAKIGKKVLFIDADFHLNPKMKTLKMKSEIKLVDLLKGQSFSASLTNMDNLHIIVSGETSPAPSEFLAQPQLEKLLGWASSEYDLVIINTPPVLECADACIIGIHAGVNVLVTRGGYTTIDDVKASVKCFNQTGVRITGVVFNGVA